MSSYVDKRVSELKHTISFEKHIRDALFSAVKATFDSIKLGTIRNRHMMHC